MYFSNPIYLLWTKLYTMSGLLGTTSNDISCCYATFERQYFIRGPLGASVDKKILDEQCTFVIQVFFKYHLPFVDKTTYHVWSTGDNFK